MKSALTMRERFEEFDAAHPDVYEQFIEITLSVYKQERERYSAYAVMHVIRFFRITSGKDASGFKIRNDYIPFYARKAVAEYPYLDGFFQLKSMWVNG